MNFANWVAEQDRRQASLTLYAKTVADVERALIRPQRDLEDFKSLLSPAAEAYLEAMAQASQRLTRQRFGITQQRFAPLYLSNAYANEGTYMMRFFDEQQAAPQSAECAGTGCRG